MASLSHEQPKEVRASMQVKDEWKVLCEMERAWKAARKERVIPITKLQELMLRHKEWKEGKGLVVIHRA